MRLTPFAVALTLASLCATPSFADAKKGKELYGQLCVTCHGVAGAGDGPVALSLPPEMKPRNLQEGKYKYATDDAKFLDLLKKGGAAVGLNPLMPAQSGTSDADLKSIIEFVKTLKK
jgi:mono/diheme cytochrome c family protein